MIRSFTVEGLRGVADSQLSLEFRPGLNILTGKNGSGKTTLMKVIWYLISGNIERATSETPFKRATIRTSDYEMHLECRGTQAHIIRISGADIDTELEQGYDGDGDIDFDNIEEDANQATLPIGSSLYFPTFRRIEGGYGIQSRRTRIGNRVSASSPVEETLDQISQQLSNQAHKFICSVSTVDISRLLLQKFTEVSEIFNQKQGKVSQDVISQIKDFKAGSTPLNSQEHDANQVLDSVRRTIEQLDAERTKTFQPISAIQSTVERIFRGKAINFGQRLSFGDAALAVASEHLSAGEKQMLSFICYNALTTGASVFIDEPELSLHADWQRELFRVLEEQDSENQFIVATHSPFIYTRYPECEIRLDIDRGDECL